MNSEKMEKFEQLQERQHDEIAAGYSLHATDKYYRIYKTKFMLEPMTENIGLSHQHVLEAMCGSGQATEHLLSRGAQVTGLDISSEMIKLFKERWPECNAIRASILNTKLKEDSFDCVVVVAGLHHLHPCVAEAIDEIYRILKPGGYFCFVEPQSGSFPDIFRKIWYKMDHLIVENEGAINIESLKSMNSHRFEFSVTKYWGNIAYLFVANSFFFRIPIALKRFYSPMFIVLESNLSRMPIFRSKRLACFVVSQWKKRI